MRSVLTALFLCFCFLASAQAYAKDCKTAALITERQFAIPDGLLVAIGIRESRFANQMWPWSINDRGKALRYQDRKDAVAAAKRLSKESSSFDVGCFQIHWRWLGRSCVSDLEDLFDAEKNAECAGRHLREMYDQTGSWHSAVEAYHVGPNRTEAKIVARAEAYACRVAKSFAQLRGRSASCN